MYIVIPGNSPRACIPIVAKHVAKHIIAASYTWLLYCYCGLKTAIAAWKSQHNLADIAAVCAKLTKYRVSQNAD